MPGMDRGASSSAESPSSLSALEAALARLRRILQEELDDLPTTVYLFGFAVKGRMHRSSDIDIAIEIHADPPPGQIAELRDRIAESSIPYHVDVILLNEVDPPFRKLVIREGKRWIG